MLSQFLSDVFPELIDSPMHDQCWVAKAIKAEHPGLSILAEAIQIVEQCRGLETLKFKVKQEHPSDSNHNPQYDARVRDCLVEACAFAWAASRGLGNPIFSDCEGTPDILLNSGRWIEVKAIHHSQEDDARMKEMLEGKVVSGQVAEAGPGLYKKFESSLDDAMKKFARQGQENNAEANVVFFNLNSVDVPTMPKKEETLDNLSKWAEKIETERAGVKLVMCFSYNWKEPFRDPFGNSEQSIRSR